MTIYQMVVNKIYNFISIGRTLPPGDPVPIVQEVTYTTYHTKIPYDDIPDGR